MVCMMGVLVLGAGLLPACSVAREPQPRRVLSPDSMELLQRAILRARPAYGTHAQALRAGVYGDLDQALAQAVERTPEVGPPTPPRLSVPDGEWVIQVGAYDNPAQAETAAEQARRRFPNISVVVERASGMHRVALSGWPSAGEAERRLGEVRRVYPDAWIRERRR